MSAGLYLHFICFVLANKLVEVFDIYDELTNICQESPFVEVGRKMGMSCLVSAYNLNFDLGVFVSMSSTLNIIDQRTFVLYRGRT
jgi:hypothetical protein